MISARNFCPGQLNSLQNAGNNTGIKPLRRAANYSGGTHSGAFTSKISPVLPKQVSVKRKKLQKRLVFTVFEALFITQTLGRGDLPGCFLHIVRFIIHIHLISHFCVSHLNFLEPKWSQYLLYSNKSFFISTFILYVIY